MLYFASQKERDRWSELLKKGRRQRPLEEVYHCEMTKVLGRGALGTVVVGFKRATGEKVAVKMVDKSLMDLEDTEQLLAEIDILRAVSQRSSCVAKYLDCFETSRMLYIVQEIIEGVNILSFLAKGRKPEPEVKGIMRDLFEGLKDIHEIGVGHRDIKMENILIA